MAAYKIVMIRFSKKKDQFLISNLVTTLYVDYTFSLLR